MPWHQEPTKDVTSCDKLWGVQIRFDPQISEWGNPAGVETSQPMVNQIVIGGEPAELKHLSRRRKRKKFDFLSSGERTGKRPNQG